MVAIGCGAAFADEPLTRGPDELTREQLADLAYLVDVSTQDDLLDEARPTKVRVIRQRPQCGLRVADGFLLGASRGEWGGEVVFSDGRAPATVLVRYNARSIHSLPFGIIAVTSQPSLNRGALYRIERLAAKKYRASRWQALPGAPRRTGLLADGSLFIECMGGSQVVISPSGDIKVEKP
jgi:hypothetical protein